jgi:hypothetical protein
MLILASTPLPVGIKDDDCFRFIRYVFDNKGNREEFIRHE